MPTMDAGIGITLSDSAPFTILAFQPGGPAERMSHQGMIRSKDVVEEIDNIAIHSMNADQVARPI